jgi:spore coat protein A, manganese oxidase
MQRRQRQLSTAAVLMAVAATSLVLPSTAAGKRLLPTLSDPDIQPKFTIPLPNLLDPEYLYQLPLVENDDNNNNNNEIDIIKMTASQGLHYTGLLRRQQQQPQQDGKNDDDNNNESLEEVATPFFGYGVDGVATWPGPTIVTKTNTTLHVQWLNQLPNQHVLRSNGNNNSNNNVSAVDTSIHWCYSLEGYQQYSIAQDGVPMVPHLHGGHSDATSDGNPEVRDTKRK